MHRSRVELFTGFLHDGKATVVVIDIGVPTAGVSVVGGTTITHHLQPLIVLGVRYCSFEEATWLTGEARETGGMIEHIK